MLDQQPLVFTRVDETIEWVIDFAAQEAAAASTNLFVIAEWAEGESHGFIETRIASFALSAPAASATQQPSTFIRRHDELVSFRTGCPAKEYIV